MGSLHLIRKNLGRKLFRSIFTTLSILIAFLLFGLLGALNHSFNLGVDLASADRLITVHKVSLIQLLPISYQRRLEQIEGVEQVIHFTWFGAYYQDPKQQFYASPTEPEKLFEMYPEWRLPEQQKQRWLDNRSGAIIGQALANTFDFKIGDRVPIGSTIWPQQDGNRSWELNIDGIFDDGGEGANEMALYFHYEYFNEARQFGQDLVGWYITKVSDPSLSEQIADQADTGFANSPTETKTMPEKGWIQSFAKQFGNISLIISSVLAAVFFTMLLVAGNTMAQAVHERTNELAVLKTLGFSDGRVLRMVLAESILLALIGGSLGLLLAAGAATGLGQAMAQFLPGFAVPPDTLLLGLGLIIALGLLAGLVPAWQAMRLNVVTALARR